MLEKELERKIVAHCKRNGVLCYKFVSPGRSGVPDRMLVFPNGRVAFAEIKVPGGRVSALQQHELKQLRQRGLPADVFWDFESFSSWLDCHL